MNNGKITILCAMESERIAQEFMKAVFHELGLRNVAVIHLSHMYYTIETKYTRTAFMYDIRKQPLDGVRADALFGMEPFKQAYKDRLAVGAPYTINMGLVDYICRVEKEVKSQEDFEKACKEYDKQIERIAKLVDIPDPEWKPTPVSDILKEIIDKHCPSESKRALELGEAFHEGFKAGIEYTETKTCTKSNEDQDKTIERVKRIMINSCYGMCGDYILEPKIKKMDIDEWSKMPPYLGQQQIYITTARGGGKTWYSEQWRKFMEQLEKEPKIKPLSKKDEETVEYCRKDVEMTSFLYKDFHLPKLETIRFNMPKAELPEIKNVIFNNPATIVVWADGTKTVVQCQDGDIYDPEKGLAMAISKKILGNKHDYYHTFKHWLKRYKKEE